MKVLVATEKPFAKIAVDGIRKEIEAAGYDHRKSTAFLLCLLFRFLNP